MKNERRFLNLLVALGLLSWVADGIIDWVFFRGAGRSLWDELLLDLPAAEVYSRLMMLACLAVVGIVSSRLLTARRRIQGFLLAGEERLATALRSVGDAVIATDIEGRITFLNPMAQRLTGWTMREALGRQLADVFPVVDECSGEPLDPPVDPVLREDLAVGLSDHSLLICRDGTRRMIEGTVAPVIGQNRKAGGTVIAFRDVTERQQTLEALRREKELAQKYLSTAGIIIVALDTQGNVTLINRKGCELLGWEEAEILGKNWFDHFIPEHLRQPVQRVFTRLMAGEVPAAAVEYHENSVRTRTGEERMIAWHNTVVTDERGASVGTFSSGEDISDRQRIFASLQESEERFRAIFTAAEDCIFIKDRELRYTHINPSMERLLGIEATAVIGCPANGVPSIGAGEHVRKTDQRALAGETVEEEITRPINGVPTTFHLIKMPIRDSSGAITGLCGIARNITHRKRSEDALRDSEARLQRQHSALAKLDVRRLLADGDFQPAVRKIAEAAAEALQVERLGVWLYTDDRTKIRCIDQYERSGERHTDGAELAVCEYPAYFAALEGNRTIATSDARTDLRIREFTDTYLAPLGITSMMDSPIRVGRHIAGIVCVEHLGPPREWTLDEQNFAGSMADLVALALQISERNRAQQALQESEEKYRCLVERANDGIAIVQDGRLVYVNPRLAETVGYAVEEVLGTAYLDHVYPDEVETIRSRYVRRIAGEPLPAVHETALRHRDGRRIDVELNAGIVTYQGAPADFVFVRDVSERSRAAEAVRESEHLLRAVVAATQEAIVSIREDGAITLFNPAAERMFGRTQEEMIGRQPDCLMPEEYRSQHQEYVRSYFAMGKPDGAIGRTHELPGVRSDGTIFPMEISLSAGRHGNRRVVTAVARDISARKQAHETAQRERDQATRIIAAMDDGIYIVGPDYTVEYANPALVRQFGPFAGKKCYEYCDGREAVCPWCRVEEARAGSTARWTWHSSTTGKTFRVLTAPIGELAENRSALVALTDVTEFEHRDQKVRHTQQLVEQLFRESLDVLLIIGEDGEVRKASEAAQSVLGFDAGELVGMNIARLLPPQEDESPDEFLARLRVYGGVFEARPIFRADGSTCRMDVTATVIPWDEGKAVFATLRDVTQRQMDEEHLQEERRIFVGGPVVVVKWSNASNWPVEYISPNVQSQFGYTPDDLTSGRVRYVDLIHPDDKARVIDKVKQHEAAGATRYEQEYRIQLPGGAYRWVHDYTAVIRDSRGAVIHYHGYLEDVTERKRNEQVKSALFEIAEATNLTANLEELLGTIHQILGRLIDTTNFFVALYDPEQDAYTFPYFVDQYDQPSFTPLQLKKSLTDYVRRTGQPLLVDEAASRLLEDRGEVEVVGTPSPIWLGTPLRTIQGTIGVVVVQSYSDPRRYTAADLELLTFVSGHLAMAIERKRAEQRLRQSEEEYRTIIENTRDLIVSITPTGTITFASPQASQYGYTPEECLGRNIAEFIHPDDVEQAIGDLQRFLMARETVPSEFRLMAKDGSAHNVEVVGAAVPEDGEIVQIMNVIRDITGRKRAEESRREAAELLQATLESTADGILTVDDNGRVINANRRFAEMWRVPDTLLQTNDDDALLAFVLDQLVDPQAFLANVRALYRTTAESFDTLHFRDGRVFERYSCPLVSSGKRVGRVWSFRDTTVRIQAEKALRESEERYRTLIENQGEGAGIVDSEERFAFANPAAEILFGVPAGGLVGRTLKEFMAPEQFAYVREQTQLRRTGEKSAYELKITRPDGEQRDLLVTATPQFDADRQFVGVFGIFRDITERKRAEEALRESEEKYRHLIEDSIEGIGISKGNRIVFANRALLNIFGYDSLEEFAKVPLLDAVAPESRQMILDKMKTKERGETALPYSDHFEYQIIRMDGTIRDIEIQVSETTINNEVFTQSTFRDITERKQAEEEVQKLASVVRHSSELVNLATLDGKMIFLNEAGAEMLGIDVEAVEQVHIMQVIPTHLKEKVQTELLPTLIRHGTWEGDLQYLNLKTGGLTDVHAMTFTVTDPNSGAPLYLANVSHDITARKHAEEALRRSEDQLRQSQKMEAVGRLAGGVAHDFNNLLSIITGHSELLLHRLGTDNRFAHHVHEINDAGQRAANLTRQLLAFSRKQVLEPRTLDLNAIVANVDNMLRRLIGEDITLLVVRGAALGAVRADGGQIEQVLMNLVINARDAMPRGGTITIEAGNVDLDEAYAFEQSDVVPGPYVMLSVSDTGHGMTEEVRAHIFEPFFTTKDPGKGTGLGLSTVYGIITQSNGHIYVDSEPGKGTTFRIYLPRIGASADTGAAEQLPKPMLRGKETILVAEDEPGVRGLVCDTLRAQGYEVISADDGVAALQLSDQRLGPVHLLVTDVVMPLMSGLDLAEHLAPKRPEMKVMYLSGYTDHEVMLIGAAGQSGAFLQKPFTLDQLCRTVRAVLDGETEAVYRRASESPADS